MAILIMERITRRQIVLVALVATAAVVLSLQPVGAADGDACLFVTTNTEDDQAEETWVYIYHESSDFQEFWKTGDDSECSIDGISETDDNEYAFDQIPPGDYRVEVNEENTGYFWGEFSVSVEANVGADNYIFINRGAVYSTGSAIASPRNSRRFTSGESASVRIDLVNGYTSREANYEVQWFIHDPGSDPTIPDLVKTGQLSSERETTLEEQIEVPDAEGTYEVTAKIWTQHTGVELGEGEPSDEVDLGEITVEEFEAPRIQSRTPSESTIRVNVSESQNFSIAATDPDSSQSQLTTTWYVDDQEINTEDMFVFDASQYAEGDHNLTVVVSDASSQTPDTERQWTVEITNQPPEFTSWAPEESLKTLRAGESLTFDVSAVDPEEGTIGIEWYLDREYQQQGSQFAHQFITPGSHNVTAVVEDPQGRRTTHKWSVGVENFREPPQVETQITSATLRPGKSGEFATVSVQHSSVNERSAQVELIIYPPDGMTVSSSSNVLEGDPAQFVGYDSIDPGEQSSISIDLEVNDESLRGKSIPIEYRVVYYPVGQRDSFRVVENQTITVNVQGDQSTSEASGPDEDSTPSPSIPGFTLWMTLLALSLWIGVSHIRKRVE